MPSCRGRRERLRGEWSLGKGGRQGGSKQAHCGWWRENNIIDNYNNHKVVPVYLVVEFPNGVISNDLVNLKRVVGKHRYFSTFRRFFVVFCQFFKIVTVALK